MTFILELSSWWSGNVHPVYQARRHGKRGGGGVRWSPAASRRVRVCEDRAATGTGQRQGDARSGRCSTRLCSLPLQGAPRDLTPPAPWIMEP